jgi:hypothetical protein
MPRASPPSPLHRRSVVRGTTTAESLGVKAPQLHPSPSGGRATLRRHSRQLLVPCPQSVPNARTPERPGPPSIRLSPISVDRRLRYFTGELPTACGSRPGGMTPQLRSVHDRRVWCRLHCVTVPTQPLGASATLSDDLGPPFRALRGFVRELDHPPLCPAVAVRTAFDLAGRLSTHRPTLELQGADTERASRSRAEGHYLCSAAKPFAAGGVDHTRRDGNSSPDHGA